MLLAFPWLTLSFFLYNLIAFTTGGADPSEAFARPLGSFTMMSGATWNFTRGDLLIAGTLVLLFFEIVKSTRTNFTSILDHILSMILFVLCLVEFIVRREAATSVFFIILLVTFIDVVAGFTVTIKGARRDFAIGEAV